MEIGSRDEEVFRDFIDSSPSVTRSPLLAGLIMRGKADAKSPQRVAGR
jgi:hypothetical protein